MGTLRGLSTLMLVVCACEVAVGDVIVTYRAAGGVDNLSTPAVELLPDTPTKVTIGIEEANSDFRSLQFVAFLRLTEMLPPEVTLSDWEWLPPEFDDSDDWFTVGFPGPHASAMGDPLQLPGGVIEVASVTVRVDAALGSTVDVLFGSPLLVGNGAGQFQTVRQNSQVATFSVVPEPGTWLIVMGGCLIPGLRRRSVSCLVAA